jgi:putative Mg2+ transporter-C (MgtC) family protein
LTIVDFTTELFVLGKLLLAVVLGGLVGFEREMAARPAGLRTHMLVAATATLLVVLAQRLVVAFTPAGVVTHDPVRVIEAIIVGISFLGAGTIFRSQAGGEPVQGLTTAASVLFTAVLGIGVALETYVLVVGATVLILFINYGLGRLEAWLAGRPG